METLSACPECGTPWQKERTCQDDFYQMLYWEAEFPEYGVVHHLMVLCYHMQHPSLYSPETLEEGKQMLGDFLAGTTPTEMRRMIGEKVNSTNRKWKIRGTETAHGSYQHPVQWTMTAHDVVLAGADHYVQSVRVWAQSIYDALKASGNI
jgi:uncharacterized OB-fold protein